MKKIVSGLAAGVFAIGIFTSSAFAAVTYDPTGGTGFVGKGDVQLALGYNNAQMQAVAENLNFTYEAVDIYQVTVSWVTGEGTRGEKIHTVAHKKSSVFNADVDYDPRRAKQYTGFILNGFVGEPTIEGIIPDVGDEFPGNSGHIVTNVSLDSSTSGLYVNGVLLQ